MNSRTWNRSGMVGSASAVAVSVVLALVGAAAHGQGSAAGQAEEEQAKAGFNYERRLGAESGTTQPSESRSRAHSVVMYQSSENGRTYVARLENGEVVSAQIDGKDVPADRVRRSGSSIEFLATDGSVLHSAKLATPPAAPVPPSVPRGAWTARTNPDSGRMMVYPLPPDAAESLTAMGSPPPVMLGITMSRPDEGMAEHLGVRAEEVIRIDSVIEGLPAATAGLRENDIVVAIDGSKPVTEAVLRETLRTKKPGDSIRLTVISRGKTNDVQVTLAAFDQERMSQWTVVLPRGSERFRLSPSAPRTAEGGGEEANGLLELYAEMVGPTREKIDEARRALEEAIAQLRSGGNATAESIKSQAIEGMQRALGSLQANAAQLSSRLRPMNSAPTPTDDAARVEPGRPQVFIAPVPGAPNEKIDRLNETIDRIERRMMEIERRLETMSSGSPTEERRRR